MQSDLLYLTYKQFNKLKHICQHKPLEEKYHLVIDNKYRNVKISHTNVM
jgi:hypothetical protein